MSATAAEIREAIEFYERLVILKTNRHYNLSSGTHEPLSRKPRESFVDYALRIRREGFPGRPMLPRERIRRRR